MLGNIIKKLLFFVMSVILCFFLSAPLTSSGIAERNAKTTAAILSQMDGKMFQVQTATDLVSFKDPGGKEFQLFVRSGELTVIPKGSEAHHATDEEVKTFFWTFAVLLLSFHLIIAHIKPYLKGEGNKDEKPPEPGK